LVITLKKATRLPKEKIMYIISGSYGQPGSALDNVSLGEHDLLSAGEGDVVIFSSDPAPPGSKTTVDAVVDRLIETGAEVHYYDLQEDLHVSGHGSQEDIKMLFAIVKPKYFVPIGSTVRHMRAYKDLVIDVGKDPSFVFELKAGDVVEFKNGQARLAGRVESRNILVDGLGVGDVGQVVLRDRKRLAKDGVVIILIQYDRSQRKLIGNPEVISRGFVFEKRKKEFLLQAGRNLRHQIDKRQRFDKGMIKEVTFDYLGRFFWEETGRRPMILPVVVEV
jgi:ribonuclease J